MTLIAKSLRYLRVECTALCIKEDIQLYLGNIITELV